MNTFIIHATHLTEREAHIRKQLDAFGMDYEFVTSYDKEQLTDEVKAEWFCRDIHLRPSEMSCAMKHVQACREIVERELQGALILEDDIVLHKDFKDVLCKSLRELGRLSEGAYLLSYEDSTLQFVPRSAREKGKILYEGSSIRCLGAYYLTRLGAKAVLEALSKRKIDCPIDFFYQGLLNENALKTLWCHPCTATQGSCMGLFASSLRQRKHRLMQERWFVKLWYKQLLYFFR